MQAWSESDRGGKKYISARSIPTVTNRCTAVQAPGSSQEHNSPLNCSSQDHYCSHMNVKMVKASRPLTNRQEGTTYTVAAIRGTRKNRLPFCKKISICLSICRSIYISIYPSVCLSVREREIHSYVHHINMNQSAAFSLRPLTFADTSCHGCKWLITDPLVWSHSSFKSRRLHPTQEPKGSGSWKPCPLQYSNKVLH